MQLNPLPYACLLGMLMTLTVSAAWGAVGTPENGEDDPWAFFSSETPDQLVIRIRGRVLETHSGKPLKKAKIVLKSGNRVIAKRLTSIDGFFSIDIPTDTELGDEVDISIEFMDHVFLKRNLKAVSQDLLVNINGEVLLEDDPIADYKLPIHVIDDVKIGRVDIRYRQRKAKKLPEDEAEEV